MKGNEGSRNLIIVLVVLVVIAAAVWAFRLIGGGSSPEDEQLEGLPQKPADLPPVTEEEKAAVPGPIDLR